jgi:predicted GNAT family N-acyltransferase
MFQYIFKKWEEALPFSYPIRHAVFVLEQNIPVNLEIDEHDSKALHLILMSDGKPIGTARILVDHSGGIGNFKIGRLAILRDFRGNGHGKKMMQHLIKYAEEKNYQKITLHAQMNALPFYEKLGFIADLEEFYEDGILHKKCTLFSIKENL